MSWIQYSSNFEDVMIRRVFSGVQAGCFVDVGAFSARYCSNTYALYQQGWRGIAIEPQAAFAGEWQALRPGDLLLNVAVGASDGIVDFFVPVDYLQRVTTSGEVAAMMRRAGAAVTQSRVARTTLNAILDAHLGGRELHLMAIDVEGSERDALAGLDFNRYRPWLLVIEATLPGTPTPSQADWEELVLAAGYICVYFDGLNRFYLRSDRLELREHFTLPPNVWDDFERYEAAMLREELAEANGRIGSMAGEIARLQGEQNAKD